MNYYEILNIKSTASEREIKKAYRILAKKYHPDTYTGNKEFAEKKMQEINIAYDTLSNLELRKAYDEKFGLNLHDETAQTSNYSSKGENYYNRYNKSGVNYEVKYRPNNNKINYDSNGYAESNYHTSESENNERYKKYYADYRKEKIKEFLTGKKLIYTLIAAAVVIGLIALFIHKSLESINEAKSIFNKINSSEQENKQNMQTNIEVLKENAKNEANELKENITPSIESFFEGLKNKEQELKDEYNKNKSESEIDDKKDILYQWGVTDPKQQEEILNFINQLNNK